MPMQDLGAVGAIGGSPQQRVDLFRELTAADRRTDWHRTLNRMPAQQGLLALAEKKEREARELRALAAALPDLGPDAEAALWDLLLPAGG